MGGFIVWVKGRSFLEWGGGGERVER